MTDERLRELTDLGEAVLMHMDQDQDYIAHYGRIGMKWYQHIYGEYQGAAKYAQKGAKKVAKMKDRYDKKYTPKIVKVLTTDSEHAVENAKKLNKAMEKDIAKIRKVEEKLKYVESTRDIYKLIDDNRRRSTEDINIVDEKEGVKQAIDESDNSLREVSPKLASAIRSDEAVSKVNKDYWRPESGSADKKGTKDYENAMNAANLGLKAMQKTGDWEPNDSSGKISGYDREWFLFEDQTIGLPTAAHLINKGHSAADVKKFYHTVNDNYDYDKDYEKYFDVVESGSDAGEYGRKKFNEFVDTCEQIKKGK